MEENKWNVYDTDVAYMYPNVMRSFHSVDELIEYYNINSSLIGKKMKRNIIEVMAEAQIKYGDIERIPEKDDFQQEYYGTFI